jgi:hypothetical protein
VSLLALGEGAASTLATKRVAAAKNFILKKMDCLATKVEERAIEIG